MGIEEKHERRPAYRYYIVNPRSLVSEAWTARDAQAAENARIRYLGRKGGELTKVTRGLKDLPADEKRVVGPVANPFGLHQFVELAFGHQGR